MHLPRSRRTLARLSAVLLALPLALVAHPATAGEDQQAATTSPVTLVAPGPITGFVSPEDPHSRAYVDFGLYLRAGAEPFELRSSRASYRDPIRTEWRSSAGPVALPAGSMPTFQGLRRFLDVRIKDEDGRTVSRFHPTVCLNNTAERARPDAPATSPYPMGCPYHPFTLGSVQGIQAGWATSLLSRVVRLGVGDYTVDARINPRYATVLGIAPADARRVVDLSIVEESFPGGGGQRAATDPLVPRRSEPVAPAAGAPAGPMVDLRSLPAFEFQLNNKGTQLRFGATTWNAGDSPLVIDGFRDEGEDHMSAYQYFYDAAGNETGHQEVGELHFHGANHQHWHFEDFARYRLLRADGSLAVRSRKNSWCLANTDAVDYTRPGAQWKPENTDLSSACGGSSALSIREVLAPGSGDSYFQFRAGQAFKIADLPNGKYVVSIEANPLGRLVESDTTNNVSLRTIWLRGKGADRRVVAAPVGVVKEKPSGSVG